MNQTELFIGIDVSKNYLGVAFGHSADAPLERFQNTPDQVAQLVARLQQLQPTLIVLGSRGGYERLLMEACRKVQLPVTHVQPQHVRAFAKAEGFTNPLDARLLARLGARIRPAAGEQVNKKLQIIAELVKRKEQLMQFRLEELDRLKVARYNVREYIKEHLEYLEQELAYTERKINELMK